VAETPRLSLYVTEPISVVMGGAKSPGTLAATETLFHRYMLSMIHLGRCCSAKIRAPDLNTCIGAKSVRSWQDHVADHISALLHPPLFWMSFFAVYAFKVTCLQRALGLKHPEVGVQEQCMLPCQCTLHGICFSTPNLLWLALVCSDMALLHSRGCRGMQTSMIETLSSPMCTWPFAGVDGCSLGPNSQTQLNSAEMTQTGSKCHPESQGFAENLATNSNSRGIPPL
jgi:hypothetical protein